VCQLFREALYKEGFIEIHTPKIVPGERYVCVKMLSNMYI
jgi:hypothetical protein